MGYAIYKVGPRWGGYGVPAICEHPGCENKIDRGMSYACGGEPFSEYGCDRYFCVEHKRYIDIEDIPNIDHEGDECAELCERCRKGESPFDYKPESKTWLKHIVKHWSWKEWREKHPEELEKIKQELNS